MLEAIDCRPAEIIYALKALMTYITDLIQLFIIQKISKAEIIVIIIAAVTSVFLGV